MEDENLIHSFYELCELGNHSRCFESEDYKDYFVKMENLLNSLRENANDEQKKLVEELSDLCLDIINITSPYDFENGFCTAMNFIQNIHDRNICVEMMLQMRNKTKKESNME